MPSGRGIRAREETPRRRRTSAPSRPCWPSRGHVARALCRRWCRRASATGPSRRAGASRRTRRTSSTAPARLRPDGVAPPAWACWSGAGRISVGMVSGCTRMTWPFMACETAAWCCPQYAYTLPQTLHPTWSRRQACRSAPRTRPSQVPGGTLPERRTRHRGRCACQGSCRCSSACTSCRCRTGSVRSGRRPWPAIVSATAPGASFRSTCVDV